MLPAARVSIDAQGRSGWGIRYQCVLLSICVHHSPKTTKKNRLRTGSVRVTTNLYKLADELVRSGWPSMPSASPFSTLVVTGNRACDTRGLFMLNFDTLAKQPKRKNFRHRWRLTCLIGIRPGNPRRPQSHSRLQLSSHPLRRCSKTVY